MQRQILGLTLPVCQILKQSDWDIAFQRSGNIECLKLLTQFMQHISWMHK